MEVPKLAASHALDAELALVSQGSQMWVWYDTDDDGRFDLALHSPGLRLYAAVDAFKVDSTGQKVEVPESEGRLLVRPGLLESATLSASLRNIVDKGLLSIMTAVKDDGLASFPHPAKDHRGTGYRWLDVGGTKKTVISAFGSGSDGYLVDLDESSFGGKPRDKIDVDKLVNDGKIDAEFAYFQRNGLVWAYYDTENHGSYDVVLFSSKPYTGRTDRGFRIDKSGKVTLDADLSGKPLIEPGLFKQKNFSSKMKKLAGEMFSDTMLEK